MSTQAFAQSSAPWDATATMQTIAAFEGTAMPAQVVQTNPQFPIGAAGCWIGSADDDYAQWCTADGVTNASRKVVVAVEYRIVLPSAFGDVLAQHMGVDARSLQPGSHMSDVFKFKRASAKEANGTIVKVSLSRIKFSDGSVWTAK